MEIGVQWQLYNVQQTYYLKEIQKVLENLAVYTSVGTNIDSTLLCRLDTSWFVQHNAATTVVVGSICTIGWVK